MSRKNKDLTHRHSLDHFSRRVRHGWLSLTFMVLGLAVPGRGQSLDPFGSGANSTVYALAVQPDGKVLAGGDFTVISGATRSCLARLNPDGSPDTNFNCAADGTVNSLTVLPNGKILVAGSFSTLGGQARRFIGQLNPDGSIDGSFNANVSNTVGAVAVQVDGKILLGGSFKGVSGQLIRGVCRLNEDGSLDAAFNPGANTNVICLALQTDGKILAGGRFTMLGAQFCSYIGRLTSDGTADPGFTAYADNWVLTLALQPDGNILVGGLFTSLNGQSRGRIGRLDEYGQLDQGFDPGADNVVYSLALQVDGKILVGGTFANLAGHACNRIARLNPDGSFDATFGASANNPVYSLALQADGKVLVGGTFTAFLGGPSRIGRLVNTGPADQSMTLGSSDVTWLRGGTGPELRRTTFELATNGTSWTDLGEGVRIPGGWYASGLTLPAKAYIRVRGYVNSGTLNGSGGLVEAFGGPPRITVSPLALTNDATTRATFGVTAQGTMPLSFQWRKDGTNLYLGGTVAGVQAGTLILSNVFGADAGGYSAVISNVYGSVTSSVAALTVRDPIITNQPVGQLANVRATLVLSVGAAGTTLKYQWRKDGLPMAGRTSNSLTLGNIQWTDRGQFDVLVSNVFGVVTSAVASLDVNLAAPEPFSGNTDNSVEAIAVQPDGRILAGGEFSFVGGQPLSCLARFNPDGSRDTNFSLTFGGTAQFPKVWALCAQLDGRVLLAGNFGTVAGQSRSYMARLKSDGTVDPSNFGLQPYVFSLVLQSDNSTLIGGSFSRFGSVSLPFYGIGRLTSTGTPDLGFRPSSGPYLRSMALQPDAQFVVGGNLSSVGTVAVTNLARLSGGGVADANFTPAANNEVYALAVQADGKILVGGIFTTLCGQPRNGLGRLNLDGTLDESFSGIVGAPLPAPYFPVVNSIAVQADGKILVGGIFTNLCGQVRSSLGRLNADGTLDGTFNPAPAVGVNQGLPIVDSLAMQADGRILVGGSFTTLAGQGCVRLGRLTNSDAATETLLFDGSYVRWMRGGTSPEVYGTAFDYSTDGVTWLNLGAGVRVPGGWQVAGVVLPPNASLRARGLVAGGKFNSSSYFVETIVGKPVIASQPLSRTNQTSTPALFTVVAAGVAPFAYQWFKEGLPLGDGQGIAGAHTPALAISNVLHAHAGNYTVIVTNASGSVTSAVATLTVVDPVMTPPRIIATDGSLGVKSNHFGFNISALPGQVVIIEASTNLANWVPLQTNLATGIGQIIFSDSASAALRCRFYRLALGQGPLPPPAIRKDSSLGFKSGRFGFNLEGIPGQTVVIEASSNLVAWTPLTSNTMGTVPLYFSDQGSASLPRRFYRLRVQ